MYAYIHTIRVCYILTGMHTNWRMYIYACTDVCSVMSCSVAYSGVEWGGMEWNGTEWNGIVRMYVCMHGWMDGWMHG